MAFLQDLRSVLISILLGCLLPESVVFLLHISSLDINVEAGHIVCLFQFSMALYELESMVSMLCFPSIHPSFLTP